MSDTLKTDDYDQPIEAPAEGPGFWIRELPYLAILALTLGGIAYSSMTHRPLVGFWEFMALFLAGVCVFTGWPAARDASARYRLIWTQALHWGAFLVAMNLTLLPSVRSIFNDDSTNLVILTLLALGTFIAGVHIGSWRMCANGVIMALGVPAIAWLDQSALFIVLVIAAVVAAAAAIFWWRHELKDGAA